MGRARPAILNVPFALGQHDRPGDLLGVVPARRPRGRARQAAPRHASSCPSPSGACASGTSSPTSSAPSSSPVRCCEYAELVHEGITLSSDAYGSVFYLTTGFHALHVTGGLWPSCSIIGRTFTARHYSHAQAAGAVVTSYYWHFVDVVWIALFATIYLLK